MENEVLNLANELKQTIDSKADKTVIDAKADKKEINDLKVDVENFKSTTTQSLEAMTEAFKQRNSTETRLSVFTKNIEKAVAEANTLLSKRTNAFVSAGQYVKIVGDMLESTNITGEVPAPAYEPGINGLPDNMFILRRYADVAGTTSNMIKFVEKQARDGAAAKQTEGQAKAQIDFDLVVNYATVDTYADYIKISNQMLNDVPFMKGEIDSELMYALNLVEEGALYTYLGTICGTMDNAGIQNKFVANTSTYFDQLLAAVTQIRLNMKGKAAANIIALNPADIFLLQANVKNANTDYIVPNWVSATGLQINGIPVVPFDGIAAGTFLVADLTKLHIRDLQSATIEIGFEMDDFTKNFVTIRAEKRFAAFVKENDYEAIIIDTFANAKAWIEA